jgi:hypothetical protein
MIFYMGIDVVAIFETLRERTSVNAPVNSIGG